MARKLVLVDEGKLLQVHMADPSAIEVTPVDLAKTQVVVVYSGSAMPPNQLEGWAQKVKDILRPMLNSLSPERRIELLITTDENQLRFAPESYMAGLGWYRLLDAMAAPDPEDVK